MQSHELATLFSAFYQSIRAGASVPPVAAEDVKYLWLSRRVLRRFPHLMERRAEAGAVCMGVFGDANPLCNLGEKAPAVAFRCAVIGWVNDVRLAEWLHDDDELDDAVFRAAATYPLVPNAVGHSGMMFDEADFLEHIRLESLRESG